MKSTSLKNSIIPVVIIILGFAVIFPLSEFLERSRPPLPAGYEDKDLALQASGLKGYSLGFEGLLADMYWMKALNYMGNKILSSKEKIDINNLEPLNLRLLYPYLDAATTLDPHFVDAYIYGAIVLPAVDKQKAIDIAKKGIANNPNEWRLYQHLGIIYWRLGDFEKAAEVYTEGSKIKDVPPFMPMMAAKMKSEGKSREMAREIYNLILEQTDEDSIKEFAQLNLMKLQSLDEIEAVNSVLETYKEEGCVKNLQQIYPKLSKVQLPAGQKFFIDKSNNLIDPGGVPYVFNQEECKIDLDLGKTKLPSN